jgi:hypothetical protein
MSAIIGHSRPAEPVWAIAGGDAAFDTDPADLNNGRVADRTAVKWPSGAQTLMTSIKLQMTWSVAQPQRISPILGLKGIPPGTKVVVTGQRAIDVAGGTFPYALGGNSATQRTFAFANGDVGAWILANAGNTDLVGIQIEVFNDVNGAPYFIADQFIYFGEIDAFQGWETPQGIKRDWSPNLDGIPSDIRAVNNQPWRFGKKPFRVAPIKLGNANYATAYGNAGAPTIVDYDKLANLVTENDLICYIPRWTDAAGALDTWALHRLAILGVARNVALPVQAGGGDRFELDMQIAESPPDI